MAANKDAGNMSGADKSDNGDKKDADQQDVALDDGSVGRVVGNVGDGEESGAQAVDKGKGKLTEPPESDLESGEIESAPPLPDEEPPPLPTDPQVPAQHASAYLGGAQEDDGWSAVQDMNGAWYFYNRFSGVSQVQNPRVPDAPTSYGGYEANAAAPPHHTHHIRPAAQGGYNPKIHGNYDPKADYAKYDREPSPDTAPVPIANVSQTAVYAQTGTFNRFTGKFQSDEQGPERHSDAAKAKRQLQAHFDMDKASNNHDGRSLKEERRNRKLSKEEVRAFNEKRKAKKEEKRRAWLRD